MHVVINPRSQAASGLASVCAHLIGALTTLLIKAITDLQISELQWVTYLTCLNYALSLPVERQATDHFSPSSSTAAAFTFLLLWWTNPTGNNAKLAAVTWPVNCFFCFCFFPSIFDAIFSIAKGVQHDGRLPFWKPACVFAHYVRIIIVFAIGEINILLLLFSFLTPDLFSTCSLVARFFRGLVISTDIRRSK